MLKEAIDYVLNQGREDAKAKKAAVVNVPGDGRTVLVEHNGDLIDRDVPPPLRSHTVDSVADLIAAYQKWSMPPDDSGQAVGVVWISVDAVVLVTDDADRRERVTLPLVKSCVFRKLESLADYNTARMDQATLVRLLRREFRHAAGAAELLSAVRKIKFRTAERGHSDIQHGNESMGAEIEAEVTGAAGIAETLIVTTNLFSNQGEREFQFSIGLDLEIDAKAQRFILRPMPDEIEVAISVALDGIKSRIENELTDAPVFYGKP